MAEPTQSDWSSDQSVALIGRGEDGLLHFVRISRSGRLAVIEYPHLAVHDDEFVTAMEYVAELDVAVPRVYLVRPPVGFAIHPVLLVKSSAACRVEIYENPTISNPGTPLMHMRHNRGSLIADDARISAWHTPTVEADGTKKWDDYTGGQGGNLAQRVGGESRPGEEFVIVPTKSWLIRITAVANDTIMRFSSEYYEVPA